MEDKLKHTLHSERAMSVDSSCLSLCQLKESESYPTTQQSCSQGCSWSLEGSAIDSHSGDVHVVIVAII